MGKKNLSILFNKSKPGQKGRRLARNLNDKAVIRALEKSKDEDHQIKFMSRGQRIDYALNKAIKLVNQNLEKQIDSEKIQGAETPVLPNVQTQQTS
jgi:hypothetical protein